MKKISILLLLICVYHFAQTITPTSGVVYVKKGSAGNGSSWSNAVGELADALKAAKTNQNIQEIWVSKGTYKPMYSPEDNNFGIAYDTRNGFLMVNNVKVYGGFPDSGTPTMNDRNFLTNETILSGDLDNNGITNINDAQHIVLSVGNVGTALLDGFTIIHGKSINTAINITINSNNITSGTIYASGGGIFIYNSSVSLNNLILTNNTAQSGGAIFTQNSSSVINNTKISNNTVASLGGAILAVYSSNILKNVSISNNIADASGGGIFNNNSYTTAINTVIQNNSAPYGGGVYNHSSQPTFVNVLIANNSATSSGGGVYNNLGGNYYNTTVVNNGNNGIYDSGTSKWYNSIIWDFVNGSNYTTATTIVRDVPSKSVINITQLGISINDIFNNPSANDFTLKSNSSAINLGNNEYFDTAIYGNSDLAGHNRIVNARIDLGAYEFQQTLATHETNVIEKKLAYPIPFKEVLNINSPADIKLLELYNMTGEIVLTKKNLPSQTTIPTSEFPAGMYILKITTRLGTESIKINKF